MSLFKPKYALFNEKIDPCCAICETGRPSPDGSQMVLCRKHGPVDGYYHCEKFVYAPLKRMPRRRPPMPQYSPDDFKL